MTEPPVHPAALPPEKLLCDCNIQFTRRSGPGGQHRNKVETAAILTHRPSGVQAEASERRSQSQNRQVALARLRINLAIEFRTPAAGSEPSKLWQSRLRGARLEINPQHVDYAALLAEALDAIEFHRLDVRAAAESLACTPTQLVKLIKLEPQAFQAFNQRRAAGGLKPLK